MDPTRGFFSKLRKMAVNLETETERLKQVYENRNTEDGDSDLGETNVQAMRTFHEVNGEVTDLKSQLQEELAQQKQRENDVSSFIKACRVMQQRVSKDIHTIRTHFEKYGYQAPCDAENPDGAKDQEAEEDEGNSEGEEDGSQEEDEGGESSSSPKTKRPFTDEMRTPQLSDVGLSALQLKRALGGAEWCSEGPPVPEMNLPRSSPKTPAPPAVYMNPKRALQMDDEEPQIPQMHEFGISEQTMCLNSDFTMDLFKKKDLKPEKPQDIPVPTVSPVTERSHTRVEDLKSPEPPLLYTPGFKIKKAGEPESLSHHGNVLSTPELPAFQTQCVNQLFSKNKITEAEPIILQSNGACDAAGDGDGHIFRLQTTPCNGPNGHMSSWEYNVAEGSFCDVEAMKMPEKPNLESVLGYSSQTANYQTLKVGEKELVKKDRTISRLDLDGPTQEFSLGTPRVRINFQEPGTPQMPDISSYTQDIFKLLSDSEMNNTSTTPMTSSVNSEKQTHSSPPPKGLSLISKSEFQKLSPYLRQMTLSSLNQAVNNINRYTAEHRGIKEEFTLEDLISIISVETKATIYILCLQELRRLQRVDAALEAKVYKLITEK
ncbi:PREDICTED: spindle and kinetochore-associated protein 3 isoform X2 [Cyprinodon variegatus]|uniref:Spindle and kinetochore associated complex subunit 3 n=1 Tax=Cyprinodon variegatus TaxID=28743 RepID=A0A3Q2ED78_CYPVA|nr:PREDICTED: spindle and kinetochore-associated protein 3 isoform X2 [Cyprinodon variegatus]